MSSPEAWLKARIESTAGVTAWPLMPAEKASPPFVVYARESTERPLQTSGLTGWADGVFTAEVYADGYLAARAVADLVRASLHNFTGTGEGATIDHVHVAAESDGEPVFLEGRDVPTYVVEFVFLIRWQE